MKVEKFCQHCGKSYFVSPYRKDRSLYCSRSCSSSSKTGESARNWRGGEIDLVCLHCGGKYSLPPSQAKGNKYCSATCRSKATRLKGKSSNFWAGGKVKYICAQCGKDFFDKASSKRRFCSMHCHDINRQKRRSGTCENCGETFEKKVSKSQRYNREFCSISCRDEFKVGKNSNNWIGGKSFEPYPITFNEPFKRKIRERDNYTCAVCKGDGNIVHHINYVKNDTVPENCITLCRSCHGKTNSNRKYWQEYFTSKSYL